MACRPVVIRHGIHRIAVKVRAADLPSLSMRVRFQEERTLGGSHHQNEVAFPDLHMLHVVQDRRPRLSYAIGARIGRGHRSRLNGLESSLHLTGPLISLTRLLRQAPLDHSPQAWRHWRTKRLRRL